MTGKKETFQISGTDASFTSRAKDLFTALDAASLKHDANSQVRKRKHEDDTYNKPDPALEDFQTLEKTPFKKPVLRSPVSKSSGRGSQPKTLHRNKVPDYKSNPKGWTKYDLSDVSAEDLSDKSNTAAALSFLNSRKTTEEKPGDDTNVNMKCVFNKPKSSSPQMEKKKTYGSKHVMPEYEVGSKQSSKKTKKRSEGIAAGGVVALGHLDYHDDEDEGGDS